VQLERLEALDLKVPLEHRVHKVKLGLREKSEFPEVLDLKDLLDMLEKVGQQEPQALLEQPEKVDKLVQQEKLVHMERMVLQVLLGLLAPPAVKVQLVTLVHPVPLDQKGRLGMPELKVQQEKLVLPGPKE